MPSSAHALNYDIIDALYTILKSSYSRIIDEHEEQVLKCLRDIPAQLQADAESAKISIHVLKSSTGQLGLQGIYDLIRKLEITYQEDACGEEAMELYRVIYTEFPVAIQTLRNYIAQK